MKVPHTKHEKTKVDEYIEKGYTASYQLEEGKLKDLKTENKFDANQVTIHDQFRYEGLSNPDDQSILYVLSTNDGRKGTLVMPYGVKADVELTAFLNQVKHKEPPEKAN